MKIGDSSKGMTFFFRAILLKNIRKQNNYSYYLCFQRIINDNNTELKKIFLEL